MTYTKTYTHAASRWFQEAKRSSRIARTAAFVLIALLAACSSDGGAGRPAGVVPDASGNDGSSPDASMPDVSTPDGSGPDSVDGDCDADVRNDADASDGADGGADAPITETRL